MPRARIATLALVTLVLGGCHRGGDITVDGRSIILHPSGAPRATITASGSLSVGPRDIHLSPAQSDLIRRYFDTVVAVNRHRQALVRQGVDLAGSSLRAATHAIGDANAKTVGDEARKGGERMRQSTLHLCGEIGDAENLQSTLAASLEAFRPYARLDVAPGVRCQPPPTRH